MFEPDKFYRKEKSDLTAADFLLLEILLAATLIIILLFLLYNKSFTLNAIRWESRFTDV